MTPRPSQPTPRAVLIALALLTAVAAALHLGLLLHQSLWFDEIFTRRIVALPDLAAVWRGVKATESTPPLVYVLEWLLGARSDAALRIVPALAMTAAVPATFAALRGLIGDRAALAAAAVLACSPMATYYAADARAYGLMVLLAVLSVHATLHARDRPGEFRALARWVAAAVLLLWTHYFGVFLVVGEGVVLLAAARPRVARTASACAVILLLGAPLIALAHAQAGSRSAFIASSSLAGRIAGTTREFATGPDIPSAWLEGPGLALAIAGALVGTWLATRHRRAMLPWLALTAAGTPLLVASIGLTDRFDSRNVLSALPLLAAITAPALLRLRAIPLAVYLLVLLTASTWIAADWRYENIDTRGAVAQAERHAPGAAVLATGRLYTPVYSAYLGRSPAGSAPLVRRAILLVQPSRAPGHRDLVPARLAPAVPPGFTAISTSEYHGFRLIELVAPTPTALSAGADEVAFGPAAN